MSGLLRRRALMMGGASLPYDAVVQYIQGDGQAYIDTGIVVTSSVSVRVTFTIQAGGAGSSIAVFGARRAANNAAMTLISLGASSPKKLSWRYGATEAILNSTGSGDYVADNTQSHRILVVTGTTSGSITASAANFDSGQHLYLFAHNAGSATASGMSPYLIIPAAEVYDGGAQVRDYIPVRVGSVGYFYDRVSGQLFGNAGSGAFTVGPDV